MATHMTTDLPLGAPLSQYLSSLTTNTNIPAWTIKNGKPIQLGFNVTIQPGQQQLNAQGQVLSYKAIENALICLDTLAKAPSTYATITQTSLFREFYQLGQHPILYANGPQTVESMTCITCGIILPPRYMEIDHARPKSNGQHEAVAKSLRVLAMTEAGPIGPKCTQLLQKLDQAAKHPQGVGPGLQVLIMDQVGRPKVNAVPPRSMRAPVVPTSMVAQRYTLNMAGTMLYSVAKQAGLTAVLELRCVHHLANLRPMCGPCNAARGNNVLKF